ncbi:50S ribosomal protein L4 [candidate division WWE3 bacterium]|nr:50S ribosomal protein L4 [candidate division WWE3 bacterium]
MNIEIKDKSGKAVENLDLDDGVFGVEPNLEALKQYLRVFLFNQRQGTSSTKTRGEVRGSGIKPWRQKGTGRARVGSRRTPVWRGGGIVHGPHPKSWRLSLNKKVLRLAIISALSIKKTQNHLNVIDKITMKKPKTKQMIEILGSHGLRGETLLVLDKKNDAVVKSSANIPNLKVSLCDNLNAFELIRNKNVLFVRNAILKVQDKYAAK